MRATAFSLDFHCVITLPFNIIVHTSLPDADSHAGRNEPYLELAIEFTMDIMKDKVMVDLLPSFARQCVALAHTMFIATQMLHSTVSSFASRAKKSVRRGGQYLKPILNERKEMLIEYGDGWKDKPVSSLDV